MATREELLEALRAADAAGDTAAATAIARRLAPSSAAQPTNPQATPPAGAPAPLERASTGSIGRGTAAHPLGAAVQLLKRRYLQGQEAEESGRSGVADAGVRGYLGLKTLAGGLDKEEQGVLREQEAEAAADPNSGARTGGRIAGGMLLSAVPAAKAAGVVGKGAAYLPKALAPAATAATVSGAQGLALNPGHGETWGEQMGDKAQEAAKDAAYGGGFAAGGQILKKALTRPFTPKPEAEALFKQGINPTLQQGADSRTGRFIGGLTSGATPSYDRQLRELEDALVDRASAGRGLPGNTRKGNVDQLEHLINQDYDQFAKGRRVPISPTLRRDMHAAANPVTPTGQFQGEARDSMRAIGNIVPDYDRNINVGYKKLQDDYLLPLRQAAKDSGNPRVEEHLMRARELLIQARNRRLTPDELAELKAIDIRNYDVNRIKEASKGGGEEREGISLPRLESAYGKAGDMPGNTTAEELVGPFARIIGQKPTQALERTKLMMAKRAVLPTLAAAGGASAAGLPLVAGTAALMAPVYGASMAGQTVGGAKYLMGQFDWQKALAEAMNKSGPYLSGSGQSLTGGE